MTPFERLQPLLILLGVLLGLGLAQMTRLATLAGELITPLLMAMLLPIKTESRRRHIQRFLKLANLSVTTLWLPIVKSLKDCKSGGYNLEGSHASLERLTRLVLLIAITKWQASPDRLYPIHFQRRVFETPRSASVRRSSPNCPEEKKSKQ